MHPNDPPTSITTPYAPHAPAPLAFTLAGCEALEEVGRGGMGVVYRGWCAELRRHEAIKVLRAGAGERDLQRFRFEAEATASLQHENILPVYRVAEHDGQPVLVTRWVGGGTLAQRRAAFRGRPRAIASLMAQVARAVHHAHQRGILHRDLKPGNILLEDRDGALDADPRPLVADFGLARWLDQSASQASGGVMGTPAYMAPEQAEGRRDLSVAVDVYGLGAILYELLTGRAPFLGESMPDILRQVLTCEPVEPHRLAPAADRDLEAVCLRCLARAPEDRYPSALSVADELDRYLAGRGVKARPPGVWDWLRQAWQRRPPAAAYTWQVPTLIGATLTVMHGGTFALVVAGGSVGGVWALMVAGQLAAWLLIWYGSLARFREVPVSQHAAAMVGVAYWLSKWAILLGQAPLEMGAPAREALVIYPALAVIGGMTLIVLGIVFWGRLMAPGAGLLLLAFVIRWTGDAAPLVYAAGFAGTLAWWGWHLRTRFAPAQARGGPPEPRP